MNIILNIIQVLLINYFVVNLYLAFNAKIVIIFQANMTRF
jgi:hypothetical protein